LLSFRLNPVSIRNIFVLSNKNNDFPETDFPICSHLSSSFPNFLFAKIGKLAGRAQGDCLLAESALQWRMPEPTRQKITFAEMRATGVRGLLIDCSDYRCSHSVAISGDRWSDDVRLSDIEPLFTCQMRPEGR
jgi:hypothetical protein